MNWTAWIRQFHRWMSVAFTVGFIANLVTMSGGEEPASWVYLLVLIPLFMLFPTGVYMLVRPYFGRRSDSRRI